jgi:hypothetical protein
MKETIRQYENLSKSLPRTDRKIFEEGDNRLSQEEQEKAAKQTDYLNDIWELRLEEEGDEFNDISELRRDTPHKVTRWDDDNLYWIPEKSLFTHCTRRYAKQCGFSTQGLHLHISSQLLMYRLALFLGKLQVKESDGYKSCWEIHIFHSDKQSFLRFWDSKGSPRVVFDGLQESENDALELLNFLTKWDFPHTYDGVIAGRMA